MTTPAESNEKLVEILKNSAAWLDVPKSHEEYSALQATRAEILEAISAIVALEERVRELTGQLAGQHLYTQQANDRANDAQSALATAKSDALEMAAKVCETLNADNYVNPVNPIMDDWADMCADAIRALKEPAK